MKYGYFKMEDEILSQKKSIWKKFQIMKRKKIVQTLIDKAINILFGICIIMLIWIVVQVFFIASFRIPSNSMEPELTNGDYVLAEKLSIGARLFNIGTNIQCYT